MSLPQRPPELKISFSLLGDGPTENWSAILRARGFRLEGDWHLKSPCRITVQHGIGILFEQWNAP
jgi:hypothetical protein